MEHLDSYLVLDNEIKGLKANFFRIPQKIPDLWMK